MDSSNQAHFARLSLRETKGFNDAKEDQLWIKEMNEELDQIENNNKWELVPRKKKKNIIGTKWVFKNKLDDEGIQSKTCVQRVY